MDHLLRLTMLCCLAVLTACAPADPESTEAGAKGPDRAARSWRDELPPTAAPANQPTGPEFQVRALEDRWYAEGRGRDQETHPEYIAITAPWVLDYFTSGQADQKILHDPYRTDWGTTRGRELDVEFLNRYGAHMRAKLWGPRLPFTDPLTGAVTNGPFPAVVFMPGTGVPAANTPYNGFAEYEPLLQQLAESGYVVFAVSPQGQNGSEHFEPPHPMCDPNGAWKEPQEMGLRELGECAGHHGPVPAYTGENAELYNAAGAIAGLVGLPEPGILIQGRLDPASLNSLLVATYDSFRHRMVFAAIDGTDWLLSADNPWRAQIDADKLGIVGHSGGADAAVVTANGDPLRRFKASVGWDSYGLPPDTVSPRVPALVIRAESQNVLGPYVTPPADHIESPYRVYRRFVDEGRDAMLLSLRGSTHTEWVYIPYALTNPIAPLTNASSKGGVVSFHYTLAWLDRWLKGGRYKDHARSRLLARQFDGFADATSIGSGTFDLLTQQNVPYRLAGESVADHLSVLFASQAHFDGVACEDWQAGCP